VHIDIFPHILPAAYYQRMVDVAPPGMLLRKRVGNIQALIDLDERLRIMDRYPDYMQVLTLASPPIDSIGGPDVTPDLAKLANDGMAEIVAKHTDRFPGFVASIGLNNPDEAMKEIDRAIGELGATGIQLYTNVAGRPLDEPEYLLVFARMAELGLPIWLHPTRTPAFPDYRDEPRSMYDMWWAFGWPYETSVAMGRIVFGGFFDRWPGLTIITHHCGAMIPYFEGRAGGGLDQLGARSEDPTDMGALKKLEKRPLDYFKMFYGDTALFGSTAALECGVAFFGADHVLFGTDMPFDPEKGPGFIRDTVASIEQMRATEEDKAKIYEGNARRMLRLSLPPER
jgi:predicted TIM-barrel fold metal-dependent hydrolase